MYPRDPSWLNVLTVDRLKLFNDVVTVLLIVKIFRPNDVLNVESWLEKKSILYAVKLESDPRPLPAKVDNDDVVLDWVFIKILVFVDSIVSFVVFTAVTVERPLFRVSKYVVIWT